MKIHTLLILLAGILWGFMGLFVRSLADIGISSTGAVFIRCAVAAIFYALTILIKDRKLFAVKLKDIWCFLGSGLCAMLFFTYCYFSSMEYLDLSTAAILLYTAPSIVIILSRILFGEKLSPLKIIALVLAFAGCCFVSGVGSKTHITRIGLLLGLGAGFGYALYSIFARLAMDRGYSSITVNLYTCFLAALGAAVIWGAEHNISVMFADIDNLILCLATGIITCYLPYLTYTYGLAGVETGKAAIMASLEPVVATLVGVFIFNEQLSLAGAAGVILVLAAIVLLNVKTVKIKEIPHH